MNYFNPNISTYSAAASPNSLAQNSPEKSLDIKMLIEENKKLKSEKERIETENEVFAHTIDVLEARVEKAESAVISYCKETKSLKTSFEKEADNIKVLKNVIKNLNIDVDKNHKDLNTANKTIKIKDKEIYNLENKTINQQQTNKKLKE